MTDGPLRTAPTADPDAIYQLLVDAHQGLDDEQSRLVGAKLTLLLANHIGEVAVIAAAVAAAREGVADPLPSPAAGDRG